MLRFVFNLLNPNKNMFKFSFLNNMKCISQLDEATFEAHTWKVRAEKELKYSEERRSY